MCGRFGLFEEPEALEGHFHFDSRDLLDIYKRRWTISPTMPVLTVEREENEDAPDRNKAKLRRWGLSGHSSRKSKGANRPLINAQGRPRTSCGLSEKRSNLAVVSYLLAAFSSGKKRCRRARRRCGFIERTKPHRFCRHLVEGNQTRRPRRGVLNSYLRTKFSGLACPPSNARHPSARLLFDLDQP